MTDISESMDFTERQKKLCELYGIDFGKVEELNSKIALLLQNLVKEGKHLEIMKGLQTNINRNLNYWLEVYGFSNSTEAKLAPRQKALLDLYLYLMLSEGVFSEIVQVITFILMVNHHDIYDVEKVDFVEDYEGLNNVFLSVKLKFLKKHGFKFVSEACDKDLRNSIAHLRIMVREDGSTFEITRKGRIGRKIKEMKKKTDYLGFVCSVTLDAIVGPLLESLKAKKQ